MIPRPWEGFWYIFDFLVKQADFVNTKWSPLAEVTFLIFIEELSFLYKVGQH